MPILWPDVAAFRAQRAERPIHALRPFAGRSSAGGDTVVGAARALQGFVERHPAQTLAYLAMLFGLFALISPGTDLIVSGWFAAPSGGFPLAASRSLLALRDLNRLLPPVILTGLLALLLAQGLGLREPALPRPHAILFVLVFYAAGPGFVVNALKMLVGRARPRNIVEFGGTHLFTPAFEASSACVQNCSFPSGEAASAVAMLALVFLLPPAWRRCAAVALVPFVLAFSLNRIAFGAHFLSDVVLSWLICGAIMLSLRPVFADRAAALDAAVTSALPRLARRLGRASGRSGAA